MPFDGASHDEVEQWASARVQQPTLQIISLSEEQRCIANEKQRPRQTKDLFPASPYSGTYPHHHPTDHETERAATQARAWVRDAMRIEAAVEREMEAQGLAPTSRAAMNRERSEAADALLEEIRAIKAAQAAAHEAARLRARELLHIDSLRTLLDSDDQPTIKSPCLSSARPRMGCQVAPPATVSQGCHTRQWVRHVFGNHTAHEVKIRQQEDDAAHQQFLQVSTQPAELLPSIDVSAEEVAYRQWREQGFAAPATKHQRERQKPSF